MSFGSGTLIYKADDFGLVITNWHVINEATGQISVHFPDGFYSPATVQKVDQDWDLAILANRKPNVEPVPLANEAPRPGDWLTIIGYGSGDYRAASGVCTQYVAPGETFPFEMVEVAVSARQGDSGGPMLNRRGELAGVLFGEGNGRTSGSYCGRVKWFLASVAPDAVRSGGQQLAVAPLAPVAARPQAMESPSEPERLAASAAQRELAGNGAATSATPVLPASIGTSGGVTVGRTVTNVPQAPAVRDPVVASTRGAGESEVHVIGWSDLAGETLAEQAKTVLAAIGVLAMILHALRWMSTEAAES
jgi:S1-C subfamily serine protease